MGSPDGRFVALADTCGGAVPKVTSSTEPFTVDTRPLADNSTSDISSCTGHNEPGNDGYFSVSMQKDERWHFHVHTLTQGVDTALYILSSCDDRSCAAGEDECGVGDPTSPTDEHLSFIAPSAGSYLVGIDSRTPGGAQFLVTAIHPVCGDGNPLEHSKGCDDGNLLNGDGCDDHCRVELAQSLANEKENNDDWLSANVLMLGKPPASMMVNGNLRKYCDFDTFAVHVPQGASLRATLFDPDGVHPCPTTTTPALRMAFLQPSGVSVGWEATSTAGTCPTISDQVWANAIATEGTYYIRLGRMNEDDPNVFPYVLKVELR
jgi:cysteine-rich repeat protein